MKAVLLRLAAVAGILAVGMTVAGSALATNDKPPNEGVCTGTHLSAGNATSFTYTAPDGFLVSSICVKAGSINQGNGPETIVYDPPQASVTFSHSSGKEISHFSVTLVTEPPEECPDGDFNGEEPGCGEPPVECPDGDFNGEEPGCGEPPVDPCPNGDLNGDRPGCEDPPVECPGGDMNGDLPGCDPIVIPPVDPPARCEPGEGPYDGKDGEPGNEECCPDSNNDQKCDEEELPPLVIEPEPKPPVVLPPPVVIPPKVKPPVAVPPKTEKPDKPKAEKPVKEKPKADKPKADPAPEVLVSSAGAETLPYTGFSLLWAVALSALLIASGLGLRRLARVKK